MSYESKIGSKVNPNPTRAGGCMATCQGECTSCYGSCAGTCENGCYNSCELRCEVGGGHSRIVPEGQLK